MKGVILAAGKGTRFHPLTYYVPKEMLPIGNKPILGHIIEEGLNSGLDEIIVVTSPKKKAVVNYIKDFWDNDIKLIYQRKPIGPTDAIWRARKYIGYDDFLLMLGDTILFDNLASHSLITEKEIYNKRSIIVGISEVAKEDAHNYGIVEGKIEGRRYKIDNIIEKPKDPKTNLALNGRYILNWRMIRMMHDNPDMHLTEIINRFNTRMRSVYGVKLDKFFDIGCSERYYDALEYYNKGKIKCRKSS